MKLHEFQAKQLLASFGVSVPRGQVVDSPDSVPAVFAELGAAKVAVKAQVHCGGRGKAGGIKLAEGVDDAVKSAGEILGMQIETIQTAGQAFPVNQVLIEEASTYERELYLAALVDRQTSQPVILVSPEGGMEIEKLAAEKPEMILHLPVNPVTGLMGYHVRDAARFLGLGKQGAKNLRGLMGAIVKTLWESDASLVEINPLVVTADEELIALDAKINLDDSGLFRHKPLAELHDPTQEEARELRAHKAGLSYVALSGSIGCLVNGAGLAMATMDLIKECGATPANFLDIGGGADKERVAEALRLILDDGNVKAILINIFGGIVRCDVVAEGVVAAAREVGIKVPLVVRLQGTNSEQGRAIINDSGMDIIAAQSLLDAAEKAVAAVGGES